MKLQFDISSLTIVSILWTAPVFGIEVAPDSLDCEKPPGSTQPHGPETSRERTARLNIEFELSLQYFDRCIAKIEQSDYASTGSGASGAGQAGNIDSEGNRGSTEHANTKSTSGTGGDGAPSLGQSASAQQSIKGGSAGLVPSNIPSGADDDIVAKQLRQAALETKEPVAREKLWEDYRKYKGIER